MKTATTPKNNYERIIKYCMLIAIYCLSLNGAFAQSVLHITNSDTYACTALANYDKIIVENGAVFQPGTCAITTKELVVHGKLRSGTGKITCETLTIDGGEWESLSAKTITVKYDCRIVNAVIGGAGTPEFAIGGNVVFEGNTTLNESAFTVTGNMEIRGTVDLQSRTGVKRVMGNVLISGFLKHSVGENIEIYGNVTCSGTIENGNYMLLGSNKALYGTMMAITRLDVEGSYTNHGTVEVKETFAGAGTFIQAENALLITHAPAEPAHLIASATGNTVRFMRNGNVTISCSEFYNMECSTTYNLNKTFPIFSLAQNTTILGSLSFTRKCFLNLQNFVLTFPQWNETLIRAVDTAGIIFNSGSIQINEIPSQQSVRIPLYHSNKFQDYAHAKLTNNNEATTNFLLTQLSDYVFVNSEMGSALPFVPVMYEITSQSNNSTLSLYWHNQRETPVFDRNNCRMVFLNDNTWEAFSEKSQAQKGVKDIYYISADYADNASGFTFGITSESFLPVGLTYFTATRLNGQNVLVWETASEHNCDYFVLLKSVDGLHFSPCARIDGTGTSNFAHTYSFHDKEQITCATYYQLAQYDYDGAVWKSKIVSTPAFDSSTTATLIRKSSTQCVLQTPHDEHCFVNDESGRIIDTFQSNTLYNFSHLTPGIYFINAEHSKIVNNRLIVR